MPNIKPIKPGQNPRAAEWNALAEAYNAGSIGAKGFEGRRLPESSGLVYIKNNSGSDRSRWDCMTLGNTTETIGTDGNESIIFAATTASADGTPVILQEPIAAGLIGVGRIFGHTLAKIATAASASDLQATPDASGHNLEPGSSGPIKILSAPSTSDASVRPVLLGAAASDGGGSKIVLASSGIAARSGTSVGSASCAEWRLDGTTLEANDGETLTVRNLSLLAIPAGTYVLAHRETISGQWIAQAILNGLRYSSPNLQYKIGDDNATDWVTWHTATTNCPP